jgi:hypothetical protein
MSTHSKAAIRKAMYWRVAKSLGVANTMPEGNPFKPNAFDFTEAAASQVRQWREKPLCVRGAISAG